MSRILSFILVLSLAIITAGPAGAKGKPFQSALPGYRFHFPFDHGAHLDFQTEWWYFTGHLRAADGRTFGYEITFFRRGNRDPDVLKNPSRWAVRQLYLAHFALTDPSGNRFRYWEKISREGIGKAGAEKGRLSVHIDDWRAEESGGKILLTSKEGTTGIGLTLTPEKPPTLQGEAGLSRKGPRPGESSYYYSLTRLRTEGNLSVDGKEMRVAGLSWMDHEFFSSDLHVGAHADSTDVGAREVSPLLIGWDWFSIQLQNRFELMFYRLRRKDGSVSPFSAGTLISPDGSSRSLSLAQARFTPLDWWESPESRGRYPIRWRIEIPEKGILLVFEPLLSKQELITRQSTRVIYWEGAMRAAGKWEGKSILGEGYLELTGYAELGADRPTDP